MDVRQDAATLELRSLRRAHRIASVPFRIIAREIDHHVLGLIWLAVTPIFHTSWLSSPDWGHPQGAWSLFLFTACWMVLEYACLSAFSTTPGKWLLGLRVDVKPGTASHWALARRCALLWLSALTLGVQKLSDFGLFFVLIFCLVSCQSPWDYCASTEVARLGLRESKKSQKPGIISYFLLAIFLQFEGKIFSLEVPTLCGRILSQLITDGY